VSLNHEKVYKLAKKDVAFNKAIELSGQKMPAFSFDTLEMGLWAAAYSGWILGTYGAKELIKRENMWKTL